MDYRLALDTGTASCALIAVELDAAREPIRVVDHSLHIFSEPVLPHARGEAGEPKKAQRRKARLARRIIDRRARRLKRIAFLASLLDLDRRTIAPDSGQRLHQIRADAATKRIALEELLLVMLKIAKRRGYAGGFKAKAESKDDDKSVVEPGIAQLKAAMEKSNAKSIGQYLARRHADGETLKLKEVGLYAHREMLIAEFNAIWEEQSKHHPVLSESTLDPLSGEARPIRDQFFDAIFFQRPLKSVAAAVGNCALEPSHPRAPMAQPAVQAFRIEKQLADLRWGMGRHASPLTAEQRAAVRDLLFDPSRVTKEGKLSFKKIYAELEKRELMPPSRRTLNMERSSREELTGDRTSRAMADLGLLEAWRALDDLTQVRTINFLADLGSPEQVDTPNWQSRFTKRVRSKDPTTGRWKETQAPRELDPAMVNFINAMVETGKFGRLASMGLETGRASYSIRALRTLTDAMRDLSIDEYGAINACYPPPAPTGEIQTRLPPHTPSGNVVVDVALGVVRRAVNEMMERMGGVPTEIIIELSREMALGLKARGEIEKKIDKNRKAREKAKARLAENDPPVPGTEINVRRYLLWEEQDHHCPYCDSHIALHEAVDGNVTNFEHILPRSLTRVGKQRNHLVIAHRACNDKKGDRTPFEAFGHEEATWKAVQYCASVLESKKRFGKAKMLVASDYEHETLDEAAIGEFTERQFHETSWIGKLAAKWLQSICPTPVMVSRGTLTAHLRRIWKLETVIPQARIEAGLPILDQDGNFVTAEEFSRFRAYWEGHGGKDVPKTDRKIDKRIDHRHHLIDALVIAQTSRSMYQRLAKHYKELAERRAAGEGVRLKLFVEPPLRAVRDTAFELVRNADIKHKSSRYVSGKFFQERAYFVESMDDGRMRGATRVKLIELTDAKGSLEKARKGISDIVSQRTRDLVSAAFESSIAKGMDAKTALGQPITDPRYGTRIRRVSVYQRLGRGFLDGSSLYQIEHGGGNVKRYVSDGYAFVSIVLSGAKIVESESVSVYRAYQISARQKPGERRYYRNDTLKDPVSGKRWVIQQLLANAAVRAAEVTEARPWIELGAESGAIQFSASSLIKLEHM